MERAWYQLVASLMFESKRPAQPGRSKEILAQLKRDLPITRTDSVQQRPQL